MKHETIQGIITGNFVKFIYIYLGDDTMLTIIYLDDGHGMKTNGKRTPKFEDNTFMHENTGFFPQEAVRTHRGVHG